MIEKIDVRFFLIGLDEKTSETDLFEVDEHDFLSFNSETSYEVSYERHTVFDNGCRQICLTKNTLETDEVYYGVNEE
jgi:hypothetical protein